jgi:hypothetical protein
MKDSTWILILAAILIAAALPGIGTSLNQMAQFSDAMEHVQAAKQKPADHMPSGMRAMISSNRTVRMYSNSGNFLKGWFSL